MVASVDDWGGWATGYYLVVPFLFSTSVVFFHELGHFLVARWCGVKVQVFSIGLGRELFWHDGSTRDPMEGFGDPVGRLCQISWR